MLVFAECSFPNLDESPVTKVVPFSEGKQYFRKSGRDSRLVFTCVEHPFPNLDEGVDVDCMSLIDRRDPVYTVHTT